MKITFLGTGAADWTVEKPRDPSEFRRFSSALIDDCLLIDPGPQILDALQELAISPNRILYIINTHKHSDHFSPVTVDALSSSGAHFCPMTAGETQFFGKYTIHAYRGNHGTCEETVHFLIHDGKSSIFYGLDGAWLLYEEVQAIKHFKPNIVVLDATIGNIDGDYRIFEHNNLSMVLEMKKTLSPYIGCFVISHLARSLHSDHKTLSEEMATHNIIVAYDGLTLNAE